MNLANLDKYNSESSKDTPRVCQIEFLRKLNDEN